MSRFSEPIPPPAPPVRVHGTAACSKPLPPARTVYAPGRGELFLRDTGGRRAPGDAPPPGAPRRPRGRGLRSVVLFTLSDGAGDVAAALDLLGAGPATVVGYSMGGAIAQLVARDHAHLVSGLVLSGTADSWREPRERRFFRGMGVLMGAPRADAELAVAPHAHALGTGMSGRIRPQMRRARIIAALVSPGVALLVAAPAALAKNGGEGLYGETNDVVITNYMFLTIIFFVVVISLFSFIQWRLDVRKHARMDARKRSAANADPRGGW